MRSLIKIYFITMSIIFLLYGCGGVKEKIGLIKKAPDEFQVYEKKPLSVPPNFELRPPSEGEVLDNEDDKKNIIFTDEENTDERLSLSDEVLLIEIGENETKENIRKIINDENSIEVVDKSVIDKILDFESVFDVEADERSEEIDPTKERERIEKLKKAGQIIKSSNEATIIEKEGSLD